MEDRAWIDFVDGKEPRRLSDGRYEADVQAGDSLHRERHVRREKGRWYWDWGAEDPGERLLVNSPLEKILRVRRIGDLYPRRR